MNNEIRWKMTSDEKRGAGREGQEVEKEEKEEQIQRDKGDIRDRRGRKEYNKGWREKVEDDWRN